MTQTSTRPSYKTPSIRAKDTRWHIVDAQDQVLGRVASRIARVLQGKHEATFTPHWDSGDRVIVINADKIRLTGNKLVDKKYRNYTGFIGGLKETSAGELLQRRPEDLIRRAVRGMLPKNVLATHILKNMKVYAGTEHPHTAQKPTKLELQ